MTGAETGALVTVATDARGPAASEPAAWALGELQQALARKGVVVRSVPLEAVARETAPESAGGAVPGASPSGGRLVLVTTLEGGGAERFAAGGVTVAGRPALRVAGSDPRGVVYGLLEVAERVAAAPDPLATIDALRAGPVIEGRPTNEVRGVLRTFASDVEDLAWFHDREAWKRYLTMLAAQRFNRFHLALGIGYDFARRMRDTYFYFPYPFLLDVPGYTVSASGVSPAERERNLASLRALAVETRRRGLHFQLGLWAGVYVFGDSPEANHTIAGLTPETHAPYCRDAIRTLLQAVPEIDGVTLRVHGESGIPEGSYDFWETVFAGIGACGRRVELDLHSKGIDGRMIELAGATGQPVTVSPKFWAEHLGLPYHQADIRALEHAGEARGEHAGLMALSTGSRRFTRYGYADLLRESRDYGVLFRVWPGTHRLLLWGDPVTGRAYSRAFTFGGARGVELFEPLAFSGRRGSGLPDGRNPFADDALRPAPPEDAWRTFAHTYRLWGRLLYDATAGPEQWLPALEADLGRAAPAAAASLACASRILPLVTTAHHPSAANNSYWPEIYTDVPIVEDAHPHPYRDTPAPRRCGTVSPLDPALFSSVEEFVAERLSGEDSGRHGPLEVARWLEALAGAALRHLAEAADLTPDWEAPAFRRWAIDVRIEAGLGRFFAGKLRAATGYALFSRTGDATALADAVIHYRGARHAWAETAGAARGVYKDDLTFGPEPHLRGHWADRLAAIDADLAALLPLPGQEASPEPTGVTPSLPHREAPAAPAGATPTFPRQEASAGPPGATPVTLETLLAERPPDVSLAHDPPPTFARGAPLPLAAEALGPVTGVRLLFRSVNQAERYRSLDLVAAPAPDGRPRWRGEIPASETATPYPLQYHFVLRDASGRARLWPGLDAAGPEPRLANQPYYVVRAGP